MPTHVMKTSWTDGASAEAVTVSATQTADVGVIGDLVIAAGKTDQLISIALDISQIKMLLITSTKAVTVETNNSATPQETLSINPDNPLTFVTGGALAISAIFAGDVTKFYATNAGAEDASLQIRVLLDGTP